MAPGARSKFGAPMFEPEDFRKQMYCTEESTCDIVGTFRRPPQSFSAPVVIWRPGNCAHLAPLVTPLLVNHEILYDTAMKSYLRPRCLPFERTGEEIFPALRASLSN